MSSTDSDADHEPSLKTVATQARWAPLAGWMLLAAFGASVAYSVWPSPLLALSFAGYWLAALVLFARPGLQRKGLSLFLLCAGILAVLAGLARGGTLSIALARSANSQIVSLLVASAFLSLIGKGREQANEVFPSGRSAIGKTLLAVHFFGSVLNFSAVYLLGDRLMRKTAMDSRQIILLTRGFAAAGFWSPFFITMAVALKYAPGASFWALTLMGGGMAALALGLTYMETSRMGDAATFVGYPFHGGTVVLPVVLMGCVGAMHFVRPGNSAVEIISMIVCLMMAGCLAAHPRRWARAFMQQVSHGLPALASEVVLFISAGIFGMGLSFLLGTMPPWMPFETFGFAQATMVFVAIVLLAQIGLHPIASISFVGPLAANLSNNPTLTASVFLYAWALSSAISPLSSQNLGAFTRYKVDGATIRYRNLRYALIMGVVMIASFYVYSLNPQKV